MSGGRSSSQLRTWLENLFGMTASSLSARAEDYPWQVLCMCRHGVSTDISRYNQVRHVPRPRHTRHVTQAGSIRPVGADRQLANEDVVTRCEICSSSLGHPRALGTGGGQRQQRGSRYLYPKLLQVTKLPRCTRVTRHLWTPPAALIQSLLPIRGGRIDIKISTQVYM